MINITKDTSQQDLINLLLSSLSDQGNLYVEVFSLPYFLATIPSIKVFQYKIQKYPRLIYWFSKDSSVLSLLKQSSLLVDFPPSLVHKPEKKTTVINLKNSNPENVTELHNHIPQQNNQLNSDQINFNLSHLTKPIDFSSSRLLDEFRKKHLEKNTKYNSKQDLDDWLQKIELTKSALSNFKPDSNNNPDKPKNQKKTFWLFDFTYNPILYRSFLSLCLISIGFGFWYFYPTNKYKIDVVPTLKQESIDAILPDSLFQKTKIQLKTSASIETTGSKINPKTSRSTGRVELINNSVGSVDFNKEGIILISESNGLEYSHKGTSSDPKVFTIPAKNVLNDQKVQIDIQAIDNGEKFNLPINSSFKVYNLKGEAMGSSFKAIAITDIKSTPNQDEKVFTEDDMSLLKSKLEKDSMDQKSKQIQILKDQNLLTNLNWFSSSPFIYNFSSIVGSKVDIVSAEGVSDIEILALPKTSLTTVVQDKLLNRNISDITIAESQNNNNSINAKLFVSYVENPESIKFDIQNKVKLSDFERASADLQTTYPNVKKVSKDFSGIHFPMVQPRNKVEITQIGDK